MTIIENCLKFNYYSYSRNRSKEKSFVNIFESTYDTIPTNTICIIKGHAYHAICLLHAYRMISQTLFPAHAHKAK